MAGAPPPCIPPKGPFPGAASVDIVWYRIWPITFADSPPISAYDSTLAAIHNAGGTILSLTFRDASGAVLPGYTCGVPPPVVVNPPPSPPPPPPPPPPPDPEGDELGLNFNILFTYLYWFINLIQYLISTPPKPGVPTECCRNVIQVLTNLVMVAEKIEARISVPGAPPPPPLDLTAVIGELSCACANLTAISSSSAAVANDLGPGLKSISDAITKQTGTDVSKIVEQLKALVKTLDPPPAVYRQLAKDGFIDAQYVQLFESGEFGSGLVTILATKLWHAIIWGLNFVGIDASTWPPKVTGRLAEFRDLISKAIAAESKFETSLVYSAVHKLLGEIQSGFIPSSATTIGQVHVDPDLLLTHLADFYMDAKVFTICLSTILPGVGKEIGKLLDVSAGILGFDEIRSVQIGPLVRHGVARVAEMNAKRLYRQELPGVNELAQLVARGLLDPSRYGQLVPLLGLPVELEAPVLKLAERGLQPFILLRLAATGLFTNRDLVDEMTFAAVRPESQHRMLLAAPFIASQKERDALRGTLEKGYAQGFFADADFTTRIEQIEHITDKSTLILDKVRLDRAFAGAKDLEAAYETEFLAGITDVPQYQSKLAGLGLQPDYVTYLMAKAEAHANARLVRQAAAAERALARATAAEERRAALTQYQAGAINESALLGLLIGTGLTPTQAAAWVLQATGQRAGKLRFQYGLRLSPAEATLLRQKVADLTKQRELQMLTDAQYVAALTALKIPPTWLNALRAGANAALKPKTAAILTPVNLP